MTHTRSLVLVVARRSTAAAGIVLALAGGASAAELAPLGATTGAPAGAPIGGNRYEAALVDVQGELDVDDYAGSFLAGERVSVSVRAAAGSTLRPVVTFIAPDGTDVSPAASVTRGGRTVAVREFEIGTTGRWAVRVSGSDGTQGAYSVEFRVRSAAAVKRTVRVAAAPDSTALDVDTTGDAMLAMNVAWQRGAGPVAITTLGLPDGRLVEGVLPRQKGSSTSLKDQPLRGGDGAATIRLASTGEPCDCVVTTRVSPRGRPSSRRVVRLSDTEPGLSALDAPIDVFVGTPVIFEGRNFDAAMPPVVRIGGREALAVRVLSATSIQVSPPTLPEGSVVSVSVTAADGQSTTRRDHVRYAPSIRIEDLLAADLKPVRQGRVAGGVTLTLRGRQFAAGQIVRFGSTEAQVLGVDSDSAMRVVVPAAPAVSDVWITVTDAGGRIASSSFTFEYVAPPSIGEKPYSPGYGAVAGGTSIVIHGSGLRSTNQLFIDGVRTPFTWVDESRIRFTSPARAAGTYTASLLDAFSEGSALATFTVKAPPVLSSFVTIGSGIADPLGLASLGGTVVRAVGTGLDETASVMVGGNIATVTGSSSGAATFVAPAGAIGSADVVVTDAAGQSATAAGALDYKAPPPAIHSISTIDSGLPDPVGVAIDGGTLVQVDGANLGGTVAVYVGSVEATLSSVSATSIRFYAPTGAAGAADIVVVDAEGQRSTLVAGVVFM